MTRDQFISDLSGWNSYLPVLWEALQVTFGDVLELGVGQGSTEKLHEYCFEAKRRLFSYESDPNYYHEYSKFDNTHMNISCPHEVTYVGDNWQIMQELHRKTIGVLFSDEAPGEQRKYNISMFCNIAQVIIAHDSENDNGYRFSLVEPLFKYHKKFMLHGVGTTAFSNFIDVTKWNI